MARCQAGDAAAWRVLVQRYQRLVHAIVRRGGLDEQSAADVFQTVFTRLVKALPTLAEPERLSAWIVTTAKREMWLQVERSRRQVSLTPARDDDDAPPGLDPADPARQPAQALEHLQQVWRVREGLQALDERCRTLLTQAAVGGEVESDYDSNGADIRAGATAIAATFIAGGSVTGKVIDAAGNTVIADTVACRVRSR